MRETLAVLLVDVGSRRDNVVLQNQGETREAGRHGLGDLGAPKLPGGLRGSEPGLRRGLAANCPPHCPQHIIDIPERRGRELISC